ncbi:MAG: YhgE/Pip family protein [Clostridium sp.]
MRRIFEIYKRDIRAIVTNWVMLVVVLGLIILPPLYAWFNIKSSWDPYGKTSGINIAIINEDNGVIIKDKELNIGNMLKEQLENNEDMGWNFISREEAESGVKLGKYYASILIPSNFTESLSSVLEGKIIKPTLVYTVNEKSNAVAPKITDKGVSTIKEEIDGEIVKTVDSAIFAIAKEVGVNFINEKSKIDKLINGVFYLENNIDNIENLIKNGNDGINTVSEITSKLKGFIPELENITVDGINIMKDGQGILGSVNTSADELNTKLKNDFKNLLNGLTEIEDKINSINTEESQDKIIAKLEDIRLKVVNIQGQVDGLIKSLKKINSLLNNKDIENAINNLVNINAKIKEVEGVLSKGIEEIDSANLQEVKERLVDSITNLKGKVEDLYNGYDTKIAPFVKKSIEYGINIFNVGEEFFTETQETIPSIKKVLNTIDEGTKIGDETLDKLLKDMPGIKESIKKYSDKIRGLQEKGDIEQLETLLGLNPEEGGVFLSSPIDVEEEILFHIPNYGSAMSPFFTTLALWVGALILVSLLSVETVHGEVEYTSIQKYFGKMLTFINIAILQGLVTSLGDILILKAYVKEPVLFVLSSCLISIIFMIIIYTLVSIFGNVGKALGVILLVLQISSSGGTFPVEVMPEFFQIIHPLLPFTYGIGIMREATAGVVKELLIYNTTILSLYGLVFIILGISLKKIINERSGYFKEKIKESGLIGH